MSGSLFEVRLTGSAAADLALIHEYVADNRSRPEADQLEADQLLDALIKRIEVLESFPMRGAVPKELEALGIREFRQVVLPPYRLIYRVIEKTVFIMVIADGRRDMQALLERRLLNR